MEHPIIMELFIFAAVAVLSANAQIPIPKRPLGYPYDPQDHSLLQFDAFLDLACPDSKNAFPVLLQLAEHYGASNLRLNVLMFPLPYHRSAWLAAQSTFIVNEMNSKVTYKWMSDMFAVQEGFYNTPTLNKTEIDIMNMLADVASKVVARSTFLSKLMKDEGDSEARVMWKYSCSRTVSGTPEFLVNGVSVAASPTWTLEDWKTVIDPLLGNKIVARKSLTSLTCGNGTKECDYLPGKMECCTSGESCIPNVGCRC